MALPPVPGWLVEYAAIRTIYLGNNVAVQQAIGALCASGAMRYCACEHKSFRNDPIIAHHFCQAQNCRCDIDGTDYEIASGFPDRRNGKKANPTDPSAQLIAACAIRNGYGVVAENKQIYLSPLDLMPGHLPALDLQGFLAAI